MRTLEDLIALRKQYIAHRDHFQGRVDMYQQAVNQVELEMIQLKAKEMDATIVEDP